MSKINKTRLLTTLALAAVLGGGSLAMVPAWHTETAQAAVEAAPQAVPVVVKTLASQDVHLWSNFSGRLHAVDAADIRPEVGGRITEIRFQDGQQVKAGDILFVIDPRPYEAAVAKAEANLASAQTNAGYAKIEIDRATELLASKAVAQRYYDERANNYRVAQAAVQSAQADLTQAKLNLDYAYVKAPISGRVSRAEITVGNLLQAGATAPVLTSIVSDNGIYADFEVDEQTYRENIRATAVNREEEGKIPVELTLAGDDAHVYRGTIFTFDNRIDTASGTIRARAKFANEDGALLPGMFVSVRLASATTSKGILVPERAVSSDQSKRYVFVVTPDNKVAYREVTLGATVDSQRVVLKGLSEGERVIVDGFQHVRPDAIVAPTELAEQPASETAKDAVKLSGDIQ